MGGEERSNGSICGRELKGRQQFELPLSTPSIPRRDRRQEQEQEGEEQQKGNSDISTRFVRVLPNEPDCALFTDTITRFKRWHQNRDCRSFKSIVMK